MSPSDGAGVSIQDVIETDLRERILLGRIEPGGRINVRQLEQHLRRLAHPDPRGDPAARGRRAGRQRPAARRGRGRRVAQRARRHLRPPADHRAAGRRNAPWRRCRAPTSTSSRRRTTRSPRPNAGRQWHRLLDGALGLPLARARARLDRRDRAPAAPALARRRSLCPPHAWRRDRRRPRSAPPALRRVRRPATAAAASDILERHLHLTGDALRSQLHQQGLE